MEAIDKQRDEINLIALAGHIGRAVPDDGTIEPMPGIRLTRASQSTEQIYATSKIAFCIIARGAKEIYLGGQLYRYDSKSYLLATAELPIKTVIFAAPEQGPYLALRVDLDPSLVGSVMVESGLVAPSAPAESKALGVSPLDSQLLDATTRLVALLGTPDEKMLVPLIRREIVYRLLTGKQGQRLRHLPAPGGHTQRIAEALERLRQDFDQPLRIDDLANDLGMSSTRFHHHFKAVTDMSPLQFQKQLRLQEARRLMLGEDFDAASAGYKVGYDDASHFSRDYKRHFGRSPMRDVENLRARIATPYQQPSV